MRQVEYYWTHPHAQAAIYITGRNGRHLHLYPTEASRQRLRRVIDSQELWVEEQVFPVPWQRRLTYTEKPNE